MMTLFRRYLFAGILVWLPIFVTVLVLSWLVTLMDKTLNLLPLHYRPDYWLGFHLPGLGVLFTLAIVFFTGLIVTNFLGAALLRLWDSLVGRIPIVRSIYQGVKKTIETVFSAQGQAFRKVLLVEYPREGLWSIAFQSGNGCAEVCGRIDPDMITIFIPTTPNPTSGFLMMVPRKNVIELDMSVDDALRFVISLGVVRPDWKGK